MAGLVGIDVFCSFCKKEIKTGDFVGVTGKWPRAVGAITLKPFKLNQTWPYLTNDRIYCKSCFDKKVKKSRK